MKRFPTLLIIAIFILSQACGSGATSGSQEITEGIKSNNPEETRRSPYNLMMLIPTEEMVVRADYIVHGKVTDVRGEVEWVGDGLQMPISTVTLDIIESLKGLAGKEIIFKSLGAIIDGQPLFSEEMPQFSLGEEVVVFLVNFGVGIFPVGHAQGKFTVTNNSTPRNGLTLPKFKVEVLNLLEE